MPYKDPAKKREHNRRWMAEWYKTKRGRENAERARRKYTQSGKANLASYRGRRFLIPLVLDRKIREGCYFCREDHPRALDYHHINSATKVFNIAAFARRPASVETLAAEIAKCVVICSRCHRRIWYWENRNGRPFPVGEFKRRGQWKRFRRMTVYVEEPWVTKARRSIASGKYFERSKFRHSQKAKQLLLEEWGERPKAT